MLPPLASIITGTKFAMSPHLQTTWSAPSGTGTENSSHQPPVLFSQNKPTTNNQPAVLFSQNKSAPASSHQPNEQVAGWLGNPTGRSFATNRYQL
jgi:hypothetical protein